MNLKKKIKLLPKDILSVINKAGALADKMGISAYVVGGFVRDILLCRTKLDIDIVVEARQSEVGQIRLTDGRQADGISFANRLARILNAHLLEHKRFGTAVLSLPTSPKGKLNKLKVDIATARSEVYPEPAALPLVSFGTIYDDLLRRDFSINAMAVVINKQNFGKLVDYFNGRIDLKDKKIRILHDSSFIDDPTRMLRAVRFEQRYGFALERKTCRLFNEAKKLDMLGKVSKHRIRDELILCLKETQPLKIINRINKLYGFSFIYSRLKLSKTNLKFMKDLDRTIRRFRIQYPKKRALDAWLIFFTVLLDGLGLQDIRTICSDFAFKKGDTRRILSYCQDHKNILRQLSRRDIRPSLVYHLLEPLSFEVIVLMITKEKGLIARKRINEFLLFHNGITLAITGKDLQDLGFLPGPHFREMLVKTLHAKIDRIIKNKKDEIKFVKEHGRRHIKD